MWAVVCEEVLKGRQRGAGMSRKAVDHLQVTESLVQGSAPFVCALTQQP